MIKFRVFANSRFLSHAETLRLFQRAGVRSGLDAVYTGGFNPRPKISLPMPRSVGLACEDETCCLQLNQSDDELDAENLKDRLNEQMPEGIEVLGIRFSETKISFREAAAVYELIVKSPYDENLGTRALQIIGSDTLKIQRRTDDRGGTKTLDVRCFLQSIEVEGPKVIITAVSSPAGSIRVDEILSLLQLGGDALDGPVKRTRVLWKTVSN